MGKVKQWARWTFWPAVLLTIVCLAMLLTGASEGVWLWFLPVYLIVGMPIIVESVVSDFSRVRRLGRFRKGATDDWL